MTRENWIRWIGSIAAAGALFILIMSRYPLVGTAASDPEIIVLYLGLGILPCYILLFLLAFGRFWWSLPFGLWILFLAVVACLDMKASPMSVILFLCALTICYTPFLNLRYQAQQRGDNP